LKINVVYSPPIANTKWGQSAQIKAQVTRFAVLRLFSCASVAAQNPPNLAELCAGTHRVRKQRDVCSKEEDKGRAQWNPPGFLTPLSISLNFVEVDANVVVFFIAFHRTIHGSFVNASRFWKLAVVLQVTGLVGVELHSSKGDSQHKSTQLVCELRVRTSPIDWGSSDSIAPRSRASTRTL